MKKEKKLLIISIISLIIFLILLLQKQIQLDLIINQNISQIQINFLTIIFIFITSIANTLPLTIFTITLFVFLLYKKRYKHSILLIASMLIGVSSELLIKYLVQKPRPLNSLIEITRYSFPSGHATMSLIFFSILVISLITFIKNKKSKTIFITLLSILIALIGFSRIYLNVHWFTDVIAGYALGTFIVSTIYLISFKSEYT